MVDIHYASSACSKKYVLVLCGLDRASVFMFINHSFEPLFFAYIFQTKLLC
jgi:hypothetical protein